MFGTSAAKGTISNILYNFTEVLRISSLWSKLSQNLARAAKMSEMV